MNTENCPAEPILLHLTLLLATLFGAPVTAAPSSTSPEGQSASRLVLDQPGFAARNGGQFHFRLQGETNRAYVIQASTNLVDWMPVAAYQIHPAVNFIKLLDAEAGSSQRRFYRAVAPSPTATANGSTVLALDPLEFYPLNTLARRNGAQIINGSWGGPAFNSQALRDAIASARVNGIIFVAAAGNSQNDNDAGNAVYPGSFDLDNIISVLATSRRDELAFFSNWGATTVDLGAPGLDVFSCWNSSDNAYQYFLGSSMAAAHVSGACALAKTQFSGESY